MNHEIVRVGPESFSEWQNVLGRVYRAHNPDDLIDPPQTGETGYLLRSDGRPTAACVVIDYSVARGESDLRCGGVAAVATVPEARGQGAAGALMRRTLQDMRETGFAIAALYAYRESYYARFGYAVCGWRWQLRCPQNRLPAVKQDLPGRLVPSDEVASLDPVYTSFIRQRSGSPRRDPRMWGQRLGKTSPQVYALGDPAEAYFWISLEKFWGDVQVGELAWSTRRGYDSAMALMRECCSNQANLVWCEPPDSPFIARHLDQGVTATLNRQTMFRVLDVKSAMTSMRSDSEGQFCFRLHDEACPWNDGVWTVTFDPDHVEVAPGGNAGFECDAATLSQALMGQPSFTELAGHGCLDPIDSQHVVRASALLSPSPVVCMEFF